LSKFELHILIKYSNKKEECIFISAMQITQLSSYFIKYNLTQNKGLISFTSESYSCINNFILWFPFFYSLWLPRLVVALGMCKVCKCTGPPS